MIEKMEFVSITGPVGDIDRITNKYLSKYEIHLENALTELSDVNDLKPYIQTNPYSSDISIAEELMSMIDRNRNVKPENITLADALDALSDINTQLQELETERRAIMEESDEISESLRMITPFRQIPYDVSEILKFKHILFRFGRIPREYYGKFQSYVQDSKDTIFYECLTDERHVWGVYFVPKSEANRVDSIFSLIHFERVYIPDQYYSTADEAFYQLEDRLQEKAEELAVVRGKIKDLIDSNAGIIISANNKLEQLSHNFDIRKKAACKYSGGKNSFILCGWMALKDIEKLRKDLEDEEQVYFVAGQETKAQQDRTPTKLKNPRLFKPYEMYTEMYGLPAYNEMDPTIFIAITYSFIFGAMYGDLGQGLCLLIGGFLLYKFKHSRLAGIIACAGVFSSIFGLLFGSFFGFEDVIPTLWLKPKEAMMSVPFIGNLNTVFVYAIGFGMILILFCMIINIRNAVRSKDTGELIFSKDALAGVIFYGALVVVIALFITGNTLPAGWILAILFIVPLILIFLKEPLTKVLEKKKEKLIDGSVGMFVCQGFFELFEVLLSYFSNTLSFVRIGAFAVSHAAMMGVVLMLAGAENGGSPNWIVVVIGNIFVMGLEGLIVGIQVLRLEYYEMFSRFYKGTGRPFNSFFEKNEEVAK